MKRIILLSLFLLVSSVSFAQWSFDARIGANASTFDASKTRQALGLKAGAGAEYTLSDLFALRSGLYFSMKGASMEGARRFEYDGDKIYRSSYLELPVLASFRFDVARNFRLALNVGPYAAYRLGGKKNGLTDVKDFDAGIDAGLDFILHNRWVIGAGCQYGLMKVGKLGTEKVNNINYSLLFGYKF